MPSYFRDDERTYRSEDFLANGFYRQGLTDQMTGEVHIQADKQVVMGGAGVFSMLPWGLVGVQGAMSTSATGQGFAVNVAYDRSNVMGLFSRYTGLRESLRLGAEYRTSDFRTPGEYIVTATGCCSRNSRIRCGCRGPIWCRCPTTLPRRFPARYQFADANALPLSPFTIKGDRYGIDLTVSKPLSPITTGSITAGYSNETIRSDYTTASDAGDLRVMARLHFRPTATPTISTSYDTLNRDAQVSAYQTIGQGLDRWETNVNVQNNQLDGRSTASASATYWGNRFETRVAHDGSMDDRATALKGSIGIDQRTSVTVGTSIAFADGAFAVGAPIRGHGFAIVEPHETIADKVCLVGTDDAIQARSDGFGPALVTDLPAYSTRTLPVDVEGLPLGYSLGQGAFETVSPYRGGYRITVGSAYSVTAFGVLMKRNGEPLTLVSGVAYQPDKPDKQVAVFTNSTGRFGADGLAPGSWIIDMATENEPTRYVVDIPAKTDGLYRAGTLTPQGGSR